MRITACLLAVSGLATSTLAGPLIAVDNLSRFTYEIDMATGTKTFNLTNAVSVFWES
jgi:hypothetical protein